MRLLIIGGTRFLGRHIVALALQRGHAVTLVHRGRSASGLFPDADHRIADRNGDHAVLSGAETWDACIDTCGYVPRHVRSLAEVIGQRVGQYQFVSSVSVYDGFARERTDEDCPLARPADPATEAVTAETYGGLKAAWKTWPARPSAQEKAVKCQKPHRILGAVLHAASRQPRARKFWSASRIAGRFGITLRVKATHSERTFEAASHVTWRTL